jgi:hypothetical protein
MPPTVDPRSGTAYVATGNPTPGFIAADRPGCNPMADAVVALEAKTVRIEWSHTMFSRPHRRPTRRGTVVCPGIYGGRVRPRGARPDS